MRIFYTYICIVLAMLCTAKTNALEVKLKLPAASVETYAKGVQTKGVENPAKVLAKDFSGMELLFCVNDAVLKKIKAEDGKEYAEVKIKNYDGFGVEAQPSLPRYSQIVEIPQDASLSVEIIEKEYQEFDIKEVLKEDLKILPFREPKIAGSNYAKTTKLSLDKAVYRQKEYKTGDLFEAKILGEGRGVRMAVLSFNPVEYFPKEGKIRVYTKVLAKLNFIGSNIAATLKKKEIYGGSNFSNLVKNDIENQDQRAALAPARTTYADGNNKPLKYVIVSHGMFKESLQRFIDFKTRQGYEVIEYYMDEFDFSGVTEKNDALVNHEWHAKAAVIRQELKNLYDNATVDNPAPSFILLVGDEPQVPTFNGTVTVQDCRTSAADCYYGDYTDDGLVEVFVGRMSASEVSQLENQIDKTIFMSEITPEQGDFLNRVVLVRGESGGIKTDITHVSKFYSGDQYTVYTQDIGTSYFTDPFGEYFNYGSGLTFYTGHANDPMFSFGLQNKDVNTYATNKDMYPLFIASTCNSGDFSHLSEWSSESFWCVGEAFQRAKDKGTVVYIGATKESFDTPNMRFTGYYGGEARGVMDALFSTDRQDGNIPERTIAEMVYTGVCCVAKYWYGYGKYYAEIQEVLGDPSYMPYIGKPERVRLSSASQVGVGGVLSVSTSPYAMVALTKGRYIAAVGEADENGNLNLSIPKSAEAGEYLLYSSAKHMAINTKTVQVSSSDVVWSDNANLKSLSVIDCALTPSFAKDVFEYRLAVEFETESIVLSGEAEDENAKVSGLGEKTLEVGDNEFEISVVAEDEVTKKVYKVVVFRMEKVSGGEEEGGSEATGGGEDGEGGSEEEEGGAGEEGPGDGDGGNEGEEGGKEDGDEGDVPGGEEGGDGEGGSGESGDNQGEDGGEEEEEVSVELGTESVAVELYPNPVKKDLHIKADAKIENIMVFDVYGKKLLFKVGDARTLDLEGLASGVYVLRIAFVGGRTTAARFVKE